MPTTNDLKNGMTLNIDGNLMNVVGFQHVKPGKGGACVRTKRKNVRTGRGLDKPFRADEPVDVAILEKREMQYLFRDETGFHFMDTQTYEQSVVDADAVGTAANWLTDGATPYVTFYEDTAIGVELPAAVEVAVTEAEPGVKGDRVSGGGGGRGGAPPAPRAAPRRRALDILYEADLLGRPIAEVLARHRDDPEAGPPDPYTVELVGGVERLLPELDERIRAAAEHWTVERMPLVDRNLLRLATFELLARPEVPTPVVLDQAIELAKLLSTADSGRFVNGVLGQVACEARGDGAGQDGPGAGPEGPGGPDP